MDFAHGNHKGLEGGNVAAHKNLKRHHDFGRNHHGIDAFVGHGAMSAHALDVDAEPVGVGHALARRA